MFGRKEKAALAALPPHHRALASEQSLAAVMSPGEWDELFASLARNDVLLRKHRLPPRLLGVIVPLVRVLSQDAGPQGNIGIRADLRGPEAPDKAHPGRDLPARPPVTKITETVVWDPWLVVNTALRDGSTLDLSVVDSTRVHKLRKRSASGKTKLKTKRKATQRIEITVRSAKGAVSVVPPAAKATAWLQVSARPKGNRVLVTAKGKYPLPDQPDASWQLKTIMLALAEVFRWVAPPPDDEPPGPAPQGEPTPMTGTSF